MPHNSKPVGRTRCSATCRAPKYSYIVASAKRNSTGINLSVVSVHTREQILGAAVRAWKKIFCGDEVYEVGVGELEVERRWKELGMAESRGGRGYDKGDAKDSLWNGGAERAAPDGLKKRAGGVDRDQDVTARDMEAVLGVEMEVMEVEEDEATTKRVMVVLIKRLRK